MVSDPAAWVPPDPATQDGPGALAPDPVQPEHTIGRVMNSTNTATQSAPDMAITAVTHPNGTLNIQEPGRRQAGPQRPLGAQQRGVPSQLQQDTQHNQSIRITGHRLSIKVTPST